MKLQRDISTAPHWQEFETITGDNTIKGMEEIITRVKQKVYPTITKSYDNKERISYDSLLTILYNTRSPAIATLLSNRNVNSMGGTKISVGRFRSMKMMRSEMDDLQEFLKLSSFEEDSPFKVLLPKREWEESSYYDPEKVGKEEGPSDEGNVPFAMRHAILQSWMANDKTVESFNAGSVRSILVSKAMRMDDPYVSLLLPFLETFDYSVMDILTSRKKKTPPLLLDKITGNIIRMIEGSGKREKWETDDEYDRRKRVDKKLSEGANDLKRKLLEGTETSFWERFAMSDHYQLQQVALTSIVNRNVKGVPMAGEDVKKRVIDYILEPKKEKTATERDKNVSRRKRLVNAYDTWTSPADCDTLKKMAEDTNESNAVASRWIFKEKCPSDYMDEKVKVAESGTPDEVSSAFEEVSTTYPTFLEKGKASNFILRAAKRSAVIGSLIVAMKKVNYKDCPLFKVMEGDEDLKNAGTRMSKEFNC